MASPEGVTEPGRPLLVTGIPRSGTTWLARRLAESPGTALPGREPMNPRGRQFALGGTVHGWVRLREPEDRQVRLLRRCYAGREPRTFSRYGARQWAAALPGTRVVVKDPFALLSVAAVAGATQAQPVLIFRHPGAVLGSYRRMGWRADTDEVAALGAPLPDGDDDVAAMASLWSWGHDIALADIAEIGRGVVVSHEELTTGGDAALAVLRGQLGLAAPRRPGRGVAGRAPARGSGLHAFSRDPGELTESWRSVLSPEEAIRVHDLTAATAASLAARRLAVAGTRPRKQAGP